MFIKIILTLMLIVLGWYVVKETIIGYKYDYMVTKANYLELKYSIESYGNDGWELVFATRASDENPASPIFKDVLTYEIIWKRKR